MTLVGSQSAASWMKNGECLKLRAGSDLGKQIWSVRCTFEKFPCKRKARNNEGRQQNFVGKTL